MLKLQSLADALGAALPQLRTDPDKLRVFVDRGRVVATAAPGSGFEYRYTASLFLLDFTAHQDAVFVPLLAWLRDNQPDLLDNAQRRGDAIQFEVEILTEGKSDLSIQIELTESVTTSPREGGGIDVVHHGEVTHADLIGRLPGVAGEPTLQALYLDGELIGQSPAP